MAGNDLVRIFGNGETVSLTTEVNLNAVSSFDLGF